MGAPDRRPAEKEEKMTGKQHLLPSERLGVPPTTPDVDLKVAAAESEDKKETKETDLFKVEKKGERK